MRVLIVDDEENIALAMKRLLERDGHTVKHVASVEDAKAFLADEVPDAIVSDVMMPGQTGADLHRWLRTERSGTLPLFAFMTGGMGDGQVRQYVEGSGVPVLEKPFTAASLLEVLGWSRA